MQKRTQGDRTVFFSLSFASAVQIELRVDRNHSRDTHLALASLSFVWSGGAFLPFPLQPLPVLI